MVVPETIDTNSERLVGYHVHDALGHRREMSPGRAWVVLETQRPAAGVETATMTCVIGGTVTVLTSQIFRVVKASFTAPV